MLKTSKLFVGGNVKFPEFKGEQHYMVPFTKQDGLPKNMLHWQDSVDAMLSTIDTTGTIYFMADQKYVKANNMHRRGGLHVDGFWNPGFSAHGGRHQGGQHLPNLPPRHGPRRHGSVSMHSTYGKVGKEELIVLASNVTGCRAALGDYEEVPWNGGSYEHLNIEDFDEVYLTPNKTFYGDTGSLLHESVPLLKDSLRTVIRLNVVMQ
jgi:hypothetical protein